MLGKVLELRCNIKTGHCDFRFIFFIFFYFFFFFFGGGGGSAITSDVVGAILF